MNINPARSLHGSMMMMMVSGVLLVLLSQASAQSEQRVEVKIKDYTFITSQVPLMPDAPTVIEVRNEDDVRTTSGPSSFKIRTHRSRAMASLPTGTGSQARFWTQESTRRFGSQSNGRDAMNFDAQSIPPCGANCSC